MMIILKQGAPPIEKIQSPLKNGVGHLSERWAAWLCHASLTTSRQCLGTAFTMHRQTHLSFGQMFSQYNRHQPPTNQPVTRHTHISRHVDYDRCNFLSRQHSDTTFLTQHFVPVTTIWHGGSYRFPHQKSFRFFRFLFRWNSGCNPTNSRKAYPVGRAPFSSRVTYVKHPCSFS